MESDLYNHCTTKRWRYGALTNENRMEFQRDQPTSFKKRKQENCIFFGSFASRRSRQAQIFRSILIGFISPVAEVSFAIITYQEFSVMLRLLIVAPLSSAIFEFMDCVEIILDFDKPLGARCQRFQRHSEKSNSLALATPRICQTKMCSGPLRTKVCFGSEEMNPDKLIDTTELNRVL